MAHWSQSILIDAIRHAFITCDDTGTCGRVLAEPVGGEKPGAVRLIHQEDRSESPYYGDDFMSQSPDIQLENALSRARSTVSKKLDERKLLMAQRISTRTWKQPTTVDYEVFDEKLVVKPTTTESLVSKLVRETPAMARNPFEEYAKFEATRSFPVPTKRFLIFLPMINKQVPPSMTVSVLVTAKVSELIGACCYRYTLNGFKPDLSTDITEFKLFMADESGEIEFDLPPLNSSENVGRIGFTALALIQNRVTSPTKLKRMITVYFPSGDCYNVDFENLNVTFAELKNIVLEKRRKAQESKGTLYHHNIRYMIEKLNEPNTELSDEATILSSNCSQFLIIRENSSRGDFIPPSKVKSKFEKQLTLPTQAAEGIKYDFQQRRMSDDISTSTIVTFEPQSFFINMVHKFKSNVPIQLAVTRDIVEVTPTFGKKTSKSLFNRSPSVKPTFYRTNRIGAIEIFDEKQGRRLCRIAHNDGSADFRYAYFEGESFVIERFGAKLNELLDKINSASRKSYMDKDTRKPSGSGGTIGRWTSFTNRSPNDSGSDYNV